MCACSWNLSRNQTQVLALNEVIATQSEEGISHTGRLHGALERSLACLDVERALDSTCLERLLEQQDRHGLKTSHNHFASNRPSRGVSLSSVQGMDARRVQTSRNSDISRDSSRAMQVRFGSNTASRKQPAGGNIVEGRVDLSSKLMVLFDGLEDAMLKCVGVDVERVEMVFVSR